MSFLPCVNDAIKVKEAVNNQEMIQSEPRVVCEVVGEANERTKNDFPGSTEPTPTLVDDTIEL